MNKNVKQRYSIRKFAIGTASTVVGAMIFIGSSQSLTAGDQNNKEVSQATVNHVEIQTEHSTANVETAGDIKQHIQDEQRIQAMQAAQHNEATHVTSTNETTPSETVQKVDQTVQEPKASTAQPTSKTKQTLSQDTTRHEAPRVENVAPKSVGTQTPHKAQTVTNQTTPVAKDKHTYQAPAPKTAANTDVVIQDVNNAIATVKQDEVSAKKDAVKASLSKNNVNTQVVERLDIDWKTASKETILLSLVTQLEKSEQYKPKSALRSAVQYATVSEKQKLDGDGQTEVGFKVLKENADKTSAMDGYMEHPATVQTKDGKTYVQFVLKKASWWKQFDLYNGTTKLNSTVVKEDTKNNTRTVQVEVPKDTTQLTSKVGITIPVINYDKHYTTRIQFDGPIRAMANSGKTQLRSVSSEAYAAKPMPVKAVASAVSKKDFAFKVLKDGTNQKSVMDDYLNHPAKTFVENGKSYVQFEMKNASWWKQFELYNGKTKLNVEQVSENKKADTRVVRVAVPSGVKTLNSKVHIVVPAINYNNKYTTQISFNHAVPKATAKPVAKPATKPMAVKPTTKPATTPIKTSPTSVKVQTTPVKAKAKAPTKQGLKNVGFKVLKNGTKQKSVMDGYMKHPAKTYVMNGKTYAEMTLTQESWWKQFDLFAGKQKLKVETLSRNKKQGTRVIRVAVPAGTKQLTSKVHIVAPQFNYNNKYTTQILFDQPLGKKAVKKKAPAKKVAVKKATAKKVVAKKAQPKKVTAKQAAHNKVKAIAVAKEAGMTTGTTSSATAATAIGTAPTTSSASEVEQVKHTDKVYSATAQQLTTAKAPQQTVQQQKQLPATGETETTTLWGILTAALGSMLLIKRRRKQ